MKRILIIAGGLQIGGAEQVCANISAYAPKNKYEFHYVVFEGYENAYGDEIERNGGKVFTLPSPGKGYVKYIRNLKKMIKKYHYSAIHSHTMFNSGVNMLVARSCGIKVRICHSHTTKTEHKVSCIKKMYESFMRKLINANATHYFACGIEAGKWLFGEKKFNQRGKVILNGIDVKKNSYNYDLRENIRNELKVQNKFVIGHTGSLLNVKNQKFLIELMPEILKKKNNAVLWLIGEGNEREMLENLIKEKQLQESVVLLGATREVYKYLNAIDVFAFPSLREGTPLSLLEAQANGIPCVVSSAVPKDVYLTDLIHSLPLEEPEKWVHTICQLKRENSETYRGILEKTGYSGENAYQPIYEAYDGKDNMARAYISLSFDDGRYDNVDAFKTYLLPKNIPVTLNVTTGYVDQSSSKEDWPCLIPAMKREEVIDLYQSGNVEIALHGNHHKNTEADMEECKNKLVEWLDLPQESVLGMASPGSGMSIDDFKKSDSELFRNCVSYLRTSLRVCTFRQLRILFRKIGRVIHLPIFYKVAYGDTIMKRCPDRIMYAVPVMKDASVGQVHAIVKKAVKKKGGLTLMFHSIDKVDKDTDNWTWDIGKFSKLCSFLEKLRDDGEVELVKTKDLYEMLKKK